jgi:glycosyltransferase involved in cell wall biosynthesis
MKKTICLNMIVKNESHVIRRCLESAKDIIDYWVIVDTGSDDGTQAIVKEILKNIPGELYERRWVDFEHNRNEALSLAKGHGDYLLLLDADDELTFPKSFCMPELTENFYYCPYQVNDIIALREFLINNHLNWKWVGKLHEYLECKEAGRGVFIEDIVNRSTASGSRSKDPVQKCLNDAFVLEKYLSDLPDGDPLYENYLFHLAVCYEDGLSYENALKSYQKILETFQNPLLIFFAYLRIGILQKRLKMPATIFMQSFLKAYQTRPSRAEPLFWMIDYFVETKHYRVGYYLVKLALRLTYEDYFAIDRSIYSYKLLYYLAECAFHMGRYKEAFEVLTKILAIPDLPPDIREAYQKNYDSPAFDLYRS